MSNLSSARSSQVSWTGTSATALGPAVPVAYAPALQPDMSLGTTQQSISSLAQAQTPLTADAIPQVRRQDKVSRSKLDHAGHEALFLSSAILSRMPLHMLGITTQCTKPCGYHAALQKQQQRQQQMWCGLCVRQILQSLAMVADTDHESLMRRSTATMGCHSALPSPSRLELYWWWHACCWPPKLSAPAPSGSPSLHTALLC